MRPKHIMHLWLGKNDDHLLLSKRIRVQNACTLCNILHSLQKLTKATQICCFLPLEIELIDLWKSKSSYSTFTENI